MWAIGGRARGGFAHGTRGCPPYRMPAHAGFARISSIANASFCPIATQRTTKSPRPAMCVIAAATAPAPDGRAHSARFARLAGADRARRTHRHHDRRARLNEVALPSRCVADDPLDVVVDADGVPELAERILQQQQTVPR